ncbi:MAG: hypothetical protein RL308_1336 [Bacteroidota bacterium]|jgi:hypothetical protein
MKVSVLVVVFFFFTSNLWSQNAAVVPYSKAYYLQKSNKQKRVGWILLGGGALFATVGGIGFSENFGIFTSNSTADGYGFLFLTGIVSGLASIPVFISSGNNARRAATITFNTDLLPIQNGLVQNLQPFFTVKIGF